MDNDITIHGYPDRGIRTSPPAINGTEQRLDAVLSELSAMRLELQCVLVALRPSVGRAETPEIDIKEPAPKPPEQSAHRKRRRRR